MMPFFLHQQNKDVTPYPPSFETPFWKDLCTVFMYESTSVIVLFCQYKLNVSGTFLPRTQSSVNGTPGLSVWAAVM